MNKYRITYTQTVNQITATDTVQQQMIYLFKSNLNIETKNKINNSSFSSIHQLTEAIKKKHEAKNEP